MLQLVTPLSETYFMAIEEHAVLVKLPTFWRAQPEVWFTQLNLHRITADNTKYYCCCRSRCSGPRCQDMASRVVLDLISQPPNDNKYQALKTHLIDTFGLNKRERAYRLLHFHLEGDSKPSALMDEMLTLLGNPPTMPTH